MTYDAQAAGRALVGQQVELAGPAVLVADGVITLT